MLALPVWTARLVIILVLAGFPIALILAWAFDVSSAGIEKTPDIPPADCPPTFSARRKNLIPLAVFGLVVAIVAGYFFIPRASARKLEKSIAVLPFDNFSAEKENAYFADGIQDDILTNLARIGDLKVISRTSVMPYRGQTHNVREIGKALNVATILEGSVRREGKRVRINVQLIDASNDKHMWAQIYDRELTDVFAIQSELAREIAAALKATLSPDEQERIEKKPTENSEAYLLYLEAHAISTRTDRSSDVLERAGTTLRAGYSARSCVRSCFCPTLTVAKLDLLFSRSHASAPGQSESGRRGSNTPAARPGGVASCARVHLLLWRA